MCKLAKSDVGPTISTINKWINISVVAGARMELDAKKIEAADDTTNVDEWTPDQLKKFAEIDQEDVAYMKKNLPNGLMKFFEGMFKQMMTESFAKEMYQVMDQYLFIESDQDKDGRLNAAEFKAFFKNQEAAMEKEFAIRYWNYTDAMIDKRFQFFCDIAGSPKGPTLKTFKKAMNMWTQVKKDSM